MRFIDALLGRRRVARADLDALFAVPAAAVTAQTALGLTPRGTASVCYRSAAGAGFAGTQGEITALLGTGSDAPQVSTSVDSYGFTWLEVARDAADGDPASTDLGALVTDLHAVNTTLEAQGFGPSLLCSVIGFRTHDDAPVALVYLYKQGTFYPFAPASGVQQRDSMLEFQVRDAIGGELPWEPDTARWLALWGAPGLD